MRYTRKFYVTLMDNFQIAIDGPVASGKGDIASRLAEKLGLLNINTGGFYRALAYACRTEGVSTKDKIAVLAVLAKTKLNLTFPRTFTVNGKDVTQEIFKEDLGASDVAIIPEVRAAMVRLQQQVAEGKKVVMEGRDIGIRVLPNAQLKIYLTASVDERARRRWEQQKQKGIERPFDEVLAETKMRDDQDMHRATDPLRKLPDAWELDTTTMTQAEVVDAIITELRKRELI